MTRPSAGALLRAAVAAGLTAYVLWRIDPAQALRALAPADWRFVAATLALVLVDRALMAWRWFLLLRPVVRTTGPPFGAILHVFFVSTFVGTFLPASVGGDAVRAVAIARHGVGLADAAASVLLDRVLGTVAILLVAAAAAIYAPPSVPSWLPVAAFASAALAMAVALSLFSRRIQSLAMQIVRRLTAGRVQKAAVGLVAAMQRYRTAGGVVLAVLAGSIAVQLLRVAQAWLLGLSLGITAGPGHYLIYIPVILLVMLLPITINGLGTSQVAFVALFGASGVPAADAFALSVLFVALGIVGNLPGGVLYATRGLSGTVDRVPIEAPHTESGDGPAGVSRDGTARRRPPRPE